MNERKKVDPFYRSAAWRRAREARLQMDHGICQECLRRWMHEDGVQVRPATMVHHIIPITERPDLKLDLTNMESLCYQCHNKEHPEKGAHGSGKRAKAPRMRVFKV